MQKAIKILIIGGSLRQPSHTQSLCELLKNTLEGLGVSSDFWDLRKKALPFHDPEFHHDQFNYPDPLVREFVQKAAAADAYIFASPIYHNSYSGVLKNAIDHLAISICQNKVAGLCSHGGNRSSQAVDHLRIVTRGLYINAITTQVCTAKEDYELIGNDRYKLINPKIIQRLNRFNNELITMASTFKSLRGQG